MQRLAGKFRVDELELRRRLTALRRGVHKAAAGRSQPAGRRSRQTKRLRSRKRQIDPWERELLELLMAHPECIESVRGRIAAEQLAAEPCRRIYETCCRLADEGLVPTFDRLMLEFDEPAMKNLLVELDETAQAKGRPAADRGGLLDELVKTMNRKEAERRRPAEIVTLREGGLDARQQAAMLEEIIRQKRDRQGISKPTDG